MKKSGFKLSPMILVIVGGLMIVVSLIVHLVLVSQNKEEREFLMGALTVTAYCEDKESFTTDTSEGVVTHYSVAVSYTIGNDDYRISIVSDDPSYASLGVHDEFMAYYHSEDPTTIRPDFTISNHAQENVIIFIVSLIGITLVVVNLITIFRNLHSPEKIEAPEEIGTLGDNTVDNGLSDSSIDYSASTPSGDNTMDSFVDPFASYTGYDESAPDENVGGFDPNAGCDQPYEEHNVQHDGLDLNDPFVSGAPQDLYPFGSAPVSEPEMPAHNEDLNNPFVTNINTDPDSPFGIRKQDDPDDYFLSQDGSLNDPFVSGDKPDYFGNN